jgi:hypothetical protein
MLLPVFTPCFNALRIKKLRMALYNQIHFKIKGFFVFGGVFWQHWGLNSGPINEPFHHFHLKI